MNIPLLNSDYEEKAPEPKFSSAKKTLAILGVSVAICAYAGYQMNLSQSQYYYDGVSYFTLDTARESAPFLIQHVTSGKYIHPTGGKQVPDDNTVAILHGGYHNSIFFTFVPLVEKPGYGILKQVTSGKALHPQGGSTNPGDNTKLIYHSGYSGATLWTFKRSKNAFTHVGGKNVHPNGGSTNPPDYTFFVTH